MRPTKDDFAVYFKEYVDRLRCYRAHLNWIKDIENMARDVGSRSSPSAEEVAEHSAAIFRLKKNISDTLTAARHFRGLTA